MSQTRRRLPPPRIRNWKTAFVRQRSSKPSVTDKLQVLLEDLPLEVSGKVTQGQLQETTELTPADLIPDICDPDLELVPPVISQSPFPKRITISQNVKLFEASVSTETLGDEKNILLKKHQRENKSLDSTVVPHLSLAKKALWSSSSAIPGRLSCESPPMTLEPHRRSLSTKSDSSKRASAAFFMPETATLTVDHRIAEAATSEQYHMLQSVSDSAFIEAVEDPSLTKTSIQIFPHIIPGAGIQMDAQAPAIDRFLLAHQLRRISTHRSKIQSEIDAGYRDYISEVFNERDVNSKIYSESEMCSEHRVNDAFEMRNVESAGFDTREDFIQTQSEFTDEGQQTESHSHGEAELDPIYKTTRKGVFMDISLENQKTVEGKPGIFRKAPMCLSKKSRGSRHNLNKPSPSPRPDSRLLPRSNRTLIRNALSRVCLAGGATGSERLRALDALDSCLSEWFIILLREQRHKFRGLYRVEAGNEGEDQVLIRIFGDGPLQIPVDSLDAFFKYDSANKCFDLLPTRHLTATTDAVSIIPKRSGTKAARTI